MGQKRIMHIDMDAFFASIEQRDQPHLRGKPVIIGMKGKRGVVSTCSYEARKFGVRSAMPVALAERKCPEGIFVQPNPKKYVYASMKVIEILHKYSSQVEPTSIDEAYLDITGKDEPKKTGMSLKNEIKDTLDITCSIGVAPNRVFAKIAASMQKPEGLTIISDYDIREKIYPLPIAELVGVGEKSEKILKRMGMNTIGDIAEYPEEKLKEIFGKNGLALKRMAKGESSDKVCAIGEQEDALSVGNEHTLHKDCGNIDIINMILLKLTEKVGRRIRKAGFAGKTVTVKMRYDDFETHTKRITYPFLIWEDEKIFSIAKSLFLSTYCNNRKIRLLGVTVSSLVKTNNVTGVNQTELFRGTPKSSRILGTIDSLKDKYGESALSRAAYLPIL